MSDIEKYRALMGPEAGAHKPIYYGILYLGAVLEAILSELQALRSREP